MTSHIALLGDSIFDNGGLEAGSFQLPPFDGGRPQIAIDGSAFASLLAGIDFTAARRGWYRRPRLDKLEKTIDTDPQV